MTTGECQSLGAFLSASRHAAADVLAQGSGGGDKLLLVLGNEASDVDSIVCALTLAFGASSGALDAIIPNLTSEYRSTPVLNIPPEDFALRQDAALMLRRLSFPESSLSFFPSLGDAALRSLMAQGRLAVILVDHNALLDRQAWLAPAVIGVVDHHEDTRAFPSAPLRIVDPAVGSCASLIAALLQKDPKGQVALTSPEVRALLSAPLLLDTGLLKSKFSETDRALARSLELMEEAGTGANVGAAALYRELLDSRIKVDGLSSRQRLRKD